VKLCGKGEIFPKIFYFCPLIVKHEQYLKRSLAFTLQSEARRRKSEVNPFLGLRSPDFRLNLN
jgi:hypothetical protein